MDLTVSFFRRQPPPLLGVDLGSTAIRLVELQRLRDAGWEVLHCASAPLPPGWVVEGEVERFDEVAAALARLVRLSGSKTRRVAMALPNSAVISKKIRLPAGLAADELEWQVESEAARLLPFAADEISLDFGVIGPVPDDNASVEVLLVATRKEKVLDRQGLAEAAGLELTVLDVESMAARLGAARTLEALPDGGRNQTLAMFEIGSRRTSLQVLRNDDLLYERELNFGGFDLTRLLAQHRGCSTDEAEVRKLAASLEADERAAVLTPWLAQLGEDMERALQFFYTSTAYNRVDSVLLAGGGAAALDAVPLASIQYPYQVVRPLADMNVAPALLAQPGMGSGTALLVATGLAMRRYPA